MKAVVFFSALFLYYSNMAMATSYAPRVNNLEGLVEASDAIVVGKLEKINNIGSFYGYQQNTTKIKALAKSGFNIPMVDFEIKILSILKEPKNHEISDKIIIRTLFSRLSKDKETENKNLEKKKKVKQLMFLKLNPDKKTFSIFSRLGLADFKIKENQGEFLIYRNNKGAPFLNKDEPAKKILDKIKMIKIDKATLP